MSKDEAIHKALKVLNCLNNDRVYETAWVKGAINACEEALEQLEGKEFFERGKEIAQWADKQAQEPVAWMYENHNIKKYQQHRDASLVLQYGYQETQLYTHPHQWQGLTDDEIVEIHNQHIQDDNVFGFARAIEAKLKDKKT